jgi:hypothetical protein
VLHITYETDTTHKKGSEEMLKEDNGLVFAAGDQVEYRINGTWYPGIVQSPGDGLISMCIRLDRAVAGSPPGRIVYCKQDSGLVRKPGEIIRH